MNRWVKESEELVKGDFYLDKLIEIYPPEEISRGLVVNEETNILKELFEQKKCKELIIELIRLKKLGFKFPIENPYIGFLSYYGEAIDKNPEALKKICDSLLKMDYVELKERLQSPKKASRRIGPMFRYWLMSNFKFLDLPEFETNEKLVFLRGGDKALKEYAEDRLKCKLGKLSKGLDFIAKIKSKYIIGTAKLITAIGGGQSGQFYEAIRLIKETKCPVNVEKVAVVDGIVWLGGKMKSILDTLGRKEYCLSALLLKKFISEVF